MKASVLSGDPFTLHKQKMDDGATALQFSHATMADLLYVLMNSIKDRQIVNETQMTGQYDFTLTIPTTALVDDADSGDLSAALITALKSIGLQLKAKRAPVRTITITHIDEPTPN